MIIKAGTHRGTLKDANGVVISNGRWAETETGRVRVIDREASKAARALVEVEMMLPAPLQWKPNYKLMRKV